MKLGTSDWWRSCYQWLTAAQIASGLAIPLIGIAQKYEIPAGDDGILAAVIFASQCHTVAWFVFFAVLLWGAATIQKFVGNPWIWDMVKLLMEDLRSDVFVGQNALVHCDRVTLFKRKRWRFSWCDWPSQDWLCSVERTGHMARKKRKWFRIMDDAHSLEGVAGTTWGQWVTIHQDNLPELKTDATDEQIKAYAARTFVHEDYVREQLRRNTHMPRSLCGMVVEAESTPWGVIVIDSALPQLAAKEKLEEFFKKHAKVLGGSVLI